MKKQYIYFATNDNDMAELMDLKLNNYFRYYNCVINCKTYKKIYDFWDELDSLSLEEQSNCLVIYDPGIYQKIPEVIESNHNFWHELGVKELYPWYELVLRYPLITPIFLVFDKNLFFNIKTIDKFCFINIKKDIDIQIKNNVTLFLQGLRTWFDPFGLREKWRNRILQAMFQDEINQNRQTNLNIYDSIDMFCVEDEIEYALFSGYTSYKYGAKVYIIDSYTLLEWSREKIQNSKSENIGIIRDLDLRFRDHVLGVANRDSLYEMKNLFPKSDKLDTLVISSETDSISGNYKIKKPLGSLYKIVEKCNKLEKSSKRLSKLKKNKKNKKNKFNTHSAPYLNMELSKEILKVTHKTTNSYKDKVFTALLHLESYLMLNNMAPTTSMQVLKDLHLAELDFELSFIGINKNQKIKDRKNDVEDDINKLLFNLENRSLKDSFLISFWNDARVVYKKHEQFNASEEANNEAMKLIEW